MARDLTVPDPAVVVDLIEAFRRSKAMFAGVSLGIFDALNGSAGEDHAAVSSGAGKTLPQLAQELGCSLDGLERLLDGLIGLQLLTREADRYRNTPAAEAYLTSSSPRRMTGYIGYSNTVMWKLWSHLEDAVKEGGHRWQQAYGWDGPIFSHFFKDERAKREFLMGMHGFGVLSSPHVVSAFDLSRFRHLADLGGATGHLVVAACERYPQLQGTVFDLPEAVPLAKEMIAQSSVPGRINVLGGDFFNDSLPPADLYALGRIIHDWSEEKARKLLKRIYEALPSGGGLLLAEKLLWDDKRGPRWAQMQNLNMLTCTEGKERTLAEYEQLLAGAGFQDVQGCRLQTPIDAILAIKP